MNNISKYFYKTVYLYILLARSAVNMTIYKGPKAMQIIPDLYGPLLKKELREGIV